VDYVRVRHVAGVDAAAKGVAEDRAYGFARDRDSADHRPPLRAAIDLGKIGPHTIAIDCQVLQADGGTRTAAICGGYIALVDALAKLPAQMPPPPPGKSASAPRYDPKFYDPRGALVEQLAAVSVGVVDRELRLDLDYFDDSRAAVDLNVAYTARGNFVEVQGSAENGGGFDRSKLDGMLGLAVRGCERLFEIQNRALEKTK
jgi:ribonuclease PH